MTDTGLAVKLRATYFGALPFKTRSFYPIPRRWVWGCSLYIMPGDHYLTTVTHSGWVWLNRGWFQRSEETKPCPSPDS